MSEEGSGELSALTAALQAAQLEKAEAYIQSDWHRVWELTNKEIPKLEQEIAALTGAMPSTEIRETSAPAPLDFESLLIEILELKNSFFNIYLRRQPSRLREVKVILTFSEMQKSVVAKHLLDHTVFYGSQGDIPVTAADLLKGPWTSKPMGEQEADKTAENAREGINDLRLIIHERARHHGD